MLVYAVLGSGGNREAVAFTLFTLILFTGSITGGHFNPAVSTGVFVTNKKWGHDFVYFLLILVA